MLYNYNLFGAQIRSEWPIPAPENAQPALLTLELRSGSPDFFSSRVPAGLRTGKLHSHFLRVLEDGSSYLYWRGQSEYHISPDGATITCRDLQGTVGHSLQTYVLGHLISHSLLRQGIETLHGATIAVNDGAITLLADSAFGKSTLTAAFLQSGFTVLSDDFLVLSRVRDTYLAHPGLPRIKLYKNVAKRLLGEQAEGTPMNQDPSPKIIFPLPPPYSMRPVPLTAIYILAPPNAVSKNDPIRIERLSRRAAYIDITKNSFNVSVRTPERLTRQLHWASELVDHIPVSRLYYPRLLPRLPDVVTSILQDLERRAPVK